MKNKKIIKKFIFIFMILLMNSYYVVQAQVKDINVESISINNANEVGKEYKNEYKEVEDIYKYITNLKSEYEILKEIDPKEFVEEMIQNKDMNMKNSKLISVIKKVLFKEISSTMKLMSVLIIIALVCSLLRNLQEAFSNSNISNIAYFTCFAAMIIVLAKSFYIGIDLSKNAIEGISNFMYAIIPVLMMLFATLGNVSQAMFMDPILISSINICITVISKIVLPLITLTFVLNFVNNLSEDCKINNLSSIIKSAVMWIQGIIMTIFVTLLTIRSIAGATMDEVTVKTAKFAVDTFIPIVGKSLSDAFTTVAGYTLLLKNSVGTLGLIVIILIMIIPIVKLFCMASLYKITGAIIEPISDKKLTNCINSCGNCLILVMSSLICVTVMCFIMIAILTATGKGIISV